MKRMSQFEMWLGLCEENKTIVHCLEGEKDNALYETKRTFLGPDWNYYSDSPVYIGWSNDRIIVSSLDYRLAYDTWKNRQGK